MTLETLNKSPTTNMNMDWQILSSKTFFQSRISILKLSAKITSTRDPLELRTLPELHHNKLSAAKNPSTKIHKDCVQAMPINPVKSHTKRLWQNTWAQYNICNHNNKKTFTIPVRTQYSDFKSLKPYLWQVQPSIITWNFSWAPGITN
jgi:hypothetical protein